MNDLKTAGAERTGAMFDVLRAWKLISTVTLSVGLLVAGVSLVLPPAYTAQTTLLPPQPPQSLAMNALGSLGSIGSLAGAAAGFKNPVDQYAGLLQTETVLDRIVDAFDLMKVYETKFREDARLSLMRRTLINVGRRDGLLTIAVNDGDARRAADIANRYVQELRRLTTELALTEAQQRRKFFEAQLDSTRAKLTEAQARLQVSGVDRGVLQTEPRAAAETYGRLRAEVEAAEVILRRLRVSMTENAPEVRQQTSALAALRERLSEAEHSTKAGQANTAYIAAYRDMKYQETLFELFSRQFELARVDEAREGAVVQVVDVARTPERRSKPKRAELTLIGVAAGFLLSVIFVLARARWRQVGIQTQAQPVN